MSTVGRIDITPGVELLARAERAEQALATTKGTLTEHVDENLDLHRRCAAHEDRIAELESALSNLVDSSSAHVEVLEAEVARWKALAGTMEKQVSDIGVWKLRLQEAERDRDAFDQERQRLVEQLEGGK